MLNIKNYLEDFKHAINVNSPSQLKMFAYRYREDDPNLEAILELDRVSLKLHLYYLKKEVLPLIEKHLDELNEGALH